MQKFITTCFLLITLGYGANAQLLRDGYWQQKVDYKIDVTLDDEAHVLHATEEVIYTNHSPDTLQFIIFHLWPNAYAAKNTALAKQLLRNGSTVLAFASQDEMGGIDSLAFTIDGLPCEVVYDEEHIDICTLNLEKPLVPRGSLKIETPFRVKLPTGRISRLGHIGQSYQITQWYPKPAVYDHKGWHDMPYLNQGEFYSEFGSFDVSITLPDNYTIGATGDLQNQKERLRLDSLAKVSQNDTNGSSSGSNAYPESSGTTKTLRYTQEKVHDFAWFADKRYQVRKGAVDLPGLEEPVTVWTMYTPRNAEKWENSISYMHDAVKYYSEWNGNYPYKQATAVDGTISAGGGMEYPNVTVIGNAQTPFALETVIMHEVGHNWFYGILGSNERDYPWLDEGLNSYNESRYLNTKYPDAYMFLGETDWKLLERTGLEQYRPGDSHYLLYLLSARMNRDQTLTTASQDYWSLNYASMVYSKTGVIFEYLRRYLGDEKMDAVMHAYFDTYKFKHPYPEDFRAVAEAVTEEDLSWLFDELMATTEKVDYRIKRVKETADGVQVRLKNQGGIHGPVPLTHTSGDQTPTTQWIEPFRRDTTISLIGNPDRIEIDAEWIVPEINRRNNYWKKKGLFGKLEPLEAGLLASIEDPRKTEFYYLPILGANLPSGLMPGFAIYNSVLPVKKLNYVLAPMFSTKALTLTGTGEAYYMLTPTASSFESIDIGIRAKRFVSDFNFSVPSIAFNRLQPYVRFDFRAPNPSGYFDHELELNAVLTQLDSIGVSDQSQRMEQFYRLNYSAEIDHPIYETSFKWSNELHEQFLRTSITVNQIVDISDKVLIRNRFFTGYFVNNATNDPRFNWRMDGQQGRNDYAFDHLLLDRSASDALLNRQMTMTHGAFKLPTAVAQSAVAITAFNVEVQPKRIPLGGFADIGTNWSGAEVYNAGLFLTLGKGLMSIYAPLIWSNNIELERVANGRTLADYIRFQINFAQLNLLDLRRKLDV